jgi:hypothetical protein
MHSLHYHHKYSITEIDNLMPWERDVMISLIKSSIQEELQQT